MQTIKTYITMKRLFLLLAFFGVLATGCEELLPTEQKPVDRPSEQPTENQIFFTDAEDNYVVSADGGKVLVIIATNLEYSIVIPEEVQSWMSVTETRAEERIDKRTFIVARNDTAVERTTIVKFVDDSNNILQTISFTQNMAEQSGTVCPNNEIWYTNDSITKASAPSNENVFGANIVSNTYDIDKECWVIKFDGEVTTIGWFAFADCTSLTSVTIPDSVTEIGDGAFYGCSSLESITIPDSVTEIGGGAFWKCSSLTSVTIPYSVTTIGDVAFNYCSSLQEFNGKFASEDSRCLIVDGVLNSFAIGCGATEYTIPDSVTEIGGGAFRGCWSLTSVTILDSVNSIGESAFSNCSSLTSVTIPYSVTEIGYSAFAFCSSLTRATITGSVTTIGDDAFGECSSLTSVTIGDSVTTIGEGAFAGCSSLTGVTIPDSVTTIGKVAFYGCDSLTSVTIGDSVTEIGDCAFSWCESLTYVYCKPTTPPVALISYDYWDAFNVNAPGRKIYVPMESVEAYKSAEWWSVYKSSIVGYNF